MKLLLAILLLTGTAFACDHESNSDARYKRIRLNAPARITLITPTTVETIHQDKFGTYINSFVIEKDSVVPKDLSLNTTKGKLWWVMFCEACRHAYVVTPVI
jgi:hypothetical protein